MAIPALTTADKVHARISTSGARLRTDHGDPLALMDVVIAQASCDVAVYLSRYPLVRRGDLPGLAESDVVQNWTADVAVYHLCRLRANPVPVSVQKRYEWVLEQLALVQAGKQTIPDLNNAAGAPAIRNYEIKDDHWPKKRVSEDRSSARGNGTFPYYPDRREPYPY